MMADEISFGIIPLRIEPKKLTHWEVLLVRHHAGHWGFPKGHQEKGEEGTQTAIRELFEETGLTIKKFINDQAFIEQYPIRRRGFTHLKTVTYYPAEVEGNISIQAKELIDCRWFSLEEAHRQLSFPEAQSILRKAQDCLSQ